MWARIHTNLQRVCIQLWQLPQEARQLVSESGVDSSQMIFDEPPALRWESIILQCENQRSLNILCPVLLARYPNNPHLKAATKPWIDGNPPEVNGDKDMPKIPDKDPKTGETPESTSIVTETPTTTTTTTHTKKVPGTNVDVDMVPVTVPSDFADDASVSIVATIPSLRLTVAQLQKDIDSLKEWREQISRLSRSEVAVEVRGNEPGPRDEDPEPPIDGNKS